MLALVLISAISLASSSAFAASYQQNFGWVVDPIQFWGITQCETRGIPCEGDHSYSGNNLEPGANLSNAELFWAVLSWADLTNANLTGANLGNADLVDADLVDANLTDANLGGADLINANLTGANLFNATLSGAFYDPNTIFPYGLDIYVGDWGLPTDATPWDLGMVPVPEPASGIMLAVGGLVLAAGGRRR
jgi:hypothetical protein